MSAGPCRQRGAPAGAVRGFCIRVSTTVECSRHGTILRATVTPEELNYARRLRRWLTSSTRPASSIDSGDPCPQDGRCSFHMDGSDVDVVMR